MFAETDAGILSGLAAKLNRARKPRRYPRAVELVAWIEERRDETHGVDAMAQSMGYAPLNPSYGPVNGTVFYQAFLG